MEHMEHMDTGQHPSQQCTWLTAESSLTLRWTMEWFPLQPESPEFLEWIGMVSLCNQNETPGYWTEKLIELLSFISVEDFRCFTYFSDNTFIYW
jgi:hypothetical protein